MTSLRQAAQQALEALEFSTLDAFMLAPISPGRESTIKAITALRAALAEPVQEPFGYLWPTGRHPEFRFTQQKRDGVDGTPLYTAPPQRTAEPVQEPVAWVECDGDLVWNNREAAIGRNLYISPQPQQTEPSQDTPPQHEYEVTANDDGTFSVALPDGEELRIIPPQRPAEPVQEPVAWRYKYSDGFWRFSNGKRVNGCDPIESQALYTAPPQRKPLTREEAIALWADKSDGPSNSEIVSFVRAVEQAHGVKERQ